MAILMPLEDFPAHFAVVEGYDPQPTAWRGSSAVRTRRRRGARTAAKTPSPSTSSPRATWDTPIRGPRRCSAPPACGSAIRPTPSGWSATMRRSPVPRHPHRNGVSTLLGRLALPAYRSPATAARSSFHRWIAPRSRRCTARASASSQSRPRRRAHHPDLPAPVLRVPAPAPEVAEWSLTPLCYFVTGSSAGRTPPSRPRGCRGRAASPRARVGHRCGSGAGTAAAPNLSKTADLLGISHPTLRSSAGDYGCSTGRMDAAPRRRPCRRTQTTSPLW